MNTDSKTLALREVATQALDAAITCLRDGLGYVASDALYDEAVKLKEAMAREFSGKSNIPAFPRVSKHEHVAYRQTTSSAGSITR